MKRYIARKPSRCDMHFADRVREVLEQLSAENERLKELADDCRWRAELARSRAELSRRLLGR